MNRQNSSDFSPLWSAAETHARETGRPPPRAVLVAYSDGSLAEVRADGRGREDWGDTPGEFPAAAGWSFRAGEAAFNGRVFAISGLRHRLLRALVGGRGHAVRDRVLKAHVWGNGDTEDGRLKDVAFGLRALLRAELGVSGDPVERVEGGYRIAL